MKGWKPKSEGPGFPSRLVSAPSVAKRIGGGFDAAADGGLGVDRKREEGAGVKSLDYGNDPFLLFHKVPGAKI